MSDNAVNGSSDAKKDIISQLFDEEEVNRMARVFIETLDSEGGFLCTTDGMTRVIMRLNEVFGIEVGSDMDTLVKKNQELLAENKRLNRILNDLTHDEKTV